MADRSEGYMADRSEGYMLIGVSIGQSMVSSVGIF